ncbi:MAG: sulfite exporter TauE/SafE family protein [Flavobacteriales bacterium]
MNPMLVTAIVLGAAGSAHCIGMCGPIALAVPSMGTTSASRWVSTFILNMGRLSTYVLLGAAIGTFGQGLRLIGSQQVVSIVAGAVLLLSVLVPGLLERWSPNGRIALSISRLRSSLAKNLHRTAPEAIFFTGALNGMLPCGLVYAALLAATSMESVVGSMGYMALFALGTWPALIALRMSGGLIGQATRAKLRRAAPFLVACLAVLMILRGMELGIPMISPPAITSPAQVTACH